MSDLISRREFLKRFCVNKDGHRIPERDCDNFEVTVSIKDIKTIIKEQPTAYDVEKVVEQLDTYITKLVGRNSALYQTVMQIVKGGGIDER
nr:MAG TPA: hypothetical protein [Caudoviricetes sp.]